MTSHILGVITGLGFSQLVTQFSKETINAPIGGSTPLYIALKNNDYKTAIKLIECGADVNKPTFINDSSSEYLNKVTATPLMYATANKKMDFVSLLLNSGADPLNNAGGEYFLSPIEMAFVLDDPTLIKQFTQKSHVTNLAIAIGLSALNTRGNDIDLDYLGFEDEQEVRKLARLYTQRKVTFNVLGLNGSAVFKGHKFFKEGFEGAIIMQKQQAKAHTQYVREITDRANFTDKDKQVIDFFNKYENGHGNHYELMQQAENIHKGSLEGILTGNNEHSAQVVFFKGYIAVCNNDDQLILDVYKIDPELVTWQDIRSMFRLFMLKEEDAKKTLDQIIMKFNPRKDALCKLFTDKSIQNKQQKSGNCVVKSGNVAKRFIQIMQELPEQTTVSKQTLANLSTILTTQKLEEIITENKKQSAFGKLLVLEEIAKNGELEKEDEEWFKEVLIARFNKWANNTPPHPYETKLLLNLIIKAENEFGFAFDLQNLSAMHSNVLMDEIVKNNQLTRTYKDWFQTALVERLFAWIKDKDPADREADKAFEALTFLDNHSLVKTYKKKTLLLNSIKNKLNALQQDQEFQNSRKNNKIIKQKYKGFIRIFNKKIAECKLLSRS